MESELNDSRISLKFMVEILAASESPIPVHVVVKKTVQGWNWGTKAWEPALHARARQVVHRGELGT